MKFSPVLDHLVLQYAERFNVIDLTTGEEKSNIKHPGSGGFLFPELHFLPDGRRLITQRYTMCVWDMPSGDLLKEHAFEDPSHVNDVDLSPDGRFFAIGCNAGLIVVEVFTNPNETKTLLRRPDAGHVSLVAFDRASRQLLVVDANENCRVWNLKSKTPSSPKWDAGAYLRFASFGPQDRWIVTVLNNGEVQLWDPKTGQPLCPPRQHGSYVSNAVLSKNGELLATAGSDGAVRLWNLLSAEDHSRQELARLGRLLAAKKLSGETLVPLDSNELEAYDFEQARSEFPEMFQVSDDQSRQWHLRQAAESMVDKRTDVAAIHREQAEALEPSAEE